jgi:hypothetical protein
MSVGDIVVLKADYEAVWSATRVLAAATTAAAKTTMAVWLDNFSVHLF